MEQDLKKRIMEIAKKYHLSHISSCITTANLLDTVYQMKNYKDPVILSNGHAGLALYCALEKYMGKNAEELWNKHGTHPNLDPKNGIWCSAGSLGCGIAIGLGMALANRLQDVYIVSSDGETKEGSWIETIRIAAELRVANLIVLVNCNGWGGYSTIDTDRLTWQIASYVKENCPKVSIIRTNMDGYPEWLQGQAGHYVKMDDKKYEEIIAKTTGQSKAREEKGNTKT